MTDEAARSCDQRQALMISTSDFSIKTFVFILVTLRRQARSSAKKSSPIVEVSSVRRDDSNRAARANEMRVDSC